MRKGISRTLLVLLTSVTLAMPAVAHASKVSRGAILGAGVGLLTGNGLKGAIGGAVVGGGLGAVGQKGYKGHKARQGAKTGAVLGAGLGLLSGNGIEGALKGAVIGGAGGALLN
ncbi:hypothetical protein [Crenobacter intestini]|uniref:hypothetical protein n=1 Tax=Crenobacter intestini TaxID=2563443 RepID=UPI00145806DF|nr:hypothetical protein [Crenobacter intestini]